LQNGVVPIQCQFDRPLNCSRKTKLFFEQINIKNHSDLVTFFNKNELSFDNFTRLSNKKKDSFLIKNMCLVDKTGELSYSILYVFEFKQKSLIDMFISKILEKDNSGKWSFLTLKNVKNLSEENVNDLVYVIINRDINGYLRYYTARDVRIITLGQRNMIVDSIFCDIQNDGLKFNILEDILSIDLDLKAKIFRFLLKTKYKEKLISIPDFELLHNYIFETDNSLSIVNSDEPLDFTRCLF